MTIILPKSRFIHIPKTGGTWISRVLRQSGLCLACCEEPHPFRSASPGEGLFTFSFVRNPLTWYPSYWRYRKWTGWNLNKAFDKDCHAETFPRFMGNVFNRRPGYYSQLIAHYVGDGDFVGRQENLASDLMIALDLAGERYVSTFPRIVAAFAPINVSPGLPSGYPPGYADGVYEMDRSVFDRFGYEEPR